MLTITMTAIASILTIMAIFEFFFAYKKSHEEVMAHDLEAIFLVLIAILCILVALVFKSLY